MESYTISVKDGIHLCDQAAKVQYEQFGKLLKVGIVLLGALITASGLYWASDRLYKGILIVVGIWAMISYNYPFVIMSERRARKTDFQFFRMEYCFGEDSVSINQSERNFILEVPYKEIIRLLEDEFCFYFFLSDKTCYLFQKGALEKDVYNNFRRFISEKTGLSIRQRRTTGLTRMSLRIRDRVENSAERISFLKPMVMKARSRRKEMEMAFRLEQEEKAAREEESRRIQEENEKIEKALHDELAADPQKMEEFKKSVMR